MAKVTLKDLVDITHAGFTYQNVKELMTMEAPAELNSPQPQADTKKAEDTTKESDISQSTPAESVNAASAAPKESEPTAAEPDYKALYEAEKEKVNSLQNKNNRADVSDAKITDDAELLEIIKSYT